MLAEFDDRVRRERLAITERHAAELASLDDDDDEDKRAEILNRHQQEILQVYLQHIARILTYAELEVY